MLRNLWEKIWGPPRPRGFRIEIPKEIKITVEVGELKVNVPTIQVQNSTNQIALSGSQPEHKVAGVAPNPTAALSDEALFDNLGSKLKTSTTAKNFGKES
jgi:hypothetical protein